TLGELRRLTGGGGLLRSAAIEDQLLAFRQRGQSALQLVQRDGAVERHRAALALVLVPTHEQRLPSLHPLPCLRRRNPRDVHRALLRHRFGGREARLHRRCRRGRRDAYRCGCAGKIPDLEIESARRRVQRPLSTAVRKSSTAALNAAGSSRFTAWPDFGSTTRAEAGILRFMKIPGSRQGPSPSPVMVNVGTSGFVRPSSSEYTVGRRIWTPRIVSAWPLADPAQRRSRNSCQPMGSFSSSCTREGPCA